MQITADSWHFRLCQVPSNRRELKREITPKVSGSFPRVDVCKSVQDLNPSIRGWCVIVFQCLSPQEPTLRALTGESQAQVHRTPILMITVLAEPLYMMQRLGQNCRNKPNKFPHYIFEDSWWLQSKRRPRTKVKVTHIR